MLCPQVFQATMEAFGPLDADPYAPRLTHQILPFFSWRLDPLAEAVDALTGLGPVERFIQPNVLCNR